MSNDHISTAEMLSDIRETRIEIADLERKAEGYKLLGDRLSSFRADACLSGITERKEFIKKVAALLEERGVKVE